MKLINIFVAGAKELAPQRIQLKAMVSDLNHKFEEQNSGVLLSVKSYETFGNKQPEYNKFITEKADLVMLVLKDRIGSYTEEEYMLALNSKRTTGKPEIVVFLEHHDDMTNELAYINGLLKNEDYYYTYVNDEDLLLKAKDYIEAFAAMSFTSKKHAITSANDKTNHSVFGRMGKWVTSVLLALLLTAAACIGWLVHENNQPMLMVLGGGSAKNFVKKYYDIDLDIHTNPMYVHMPSGASWLMLAEEVITPFRGTGTPKYYPVCLSASQAHVDDFTSVATAEKYKDIGTIFEYKFNKQDILSIAVDRTKVLGLLSSDEYESQSISIHTLGQLLNDPEMKIYMTSKDSGTRAKYLKALNKAGISLDTTRVEIFSENSDYGLIANNNFVVLGSECYLPYKALNDTLHNGKALKDYIELKVFEGDHDYIAKDMYFYFMAYKKVGDMRIESDRLYIPEPTLQFIDRLQSQGADDTYKLRDMVDEHNCIKAPKDFYVLIPYTEYLNTTPIK